jgi:hypothetical protein
MKVGYINVNESLKILNKHINDQNCPNSNIDHPLLLYTCFTHY